MIITFDIETQGLNAQNFLFGCIATEDNKTSVHRTKTDLWETILTIGKKQASYQKTVTAYAHNLSYDFYGICPWPAGIKIISTRPLIVEYQNITFIDSMHLYRGSLSDMGTLCGLPKTPTPEWLKQTSYTPSDAELWEAERYCAQDCLVLLNGIKKLREQLKSINACPRHLITIGQSSINAYLKYLQQQPQPAHYFSLEPDEYGRPGHKIGRFPHVHYATQQLEAYRGGRIESFQTGDYTGVHYVDINSLYPHAMILMPYPNLNTETYVDNPAWEDIAKAYGVARVHIIAPTCALGYLPIREHNDTYYPHSGEHLIGTWTLHELRGALKRGYKIQHVFWGILYETLNTNPLIPYISALYEQKKNAPNTYERWFAKQLMNHLYGKFAQINDNIQYQTIPIEELPTYQATGWEAHAYHDLTVIIKKQGTIEYKKFFAPIISCHITAYARNLITEQLETLRPEQRLYTDTDSIIYIGTGEEFKYSEELGRFKHVHGPTTATIYGKKDYTIADESHISGSTSTPALQKARIAERRRMLTINDTNDTNLLGTFVTTNVTIGSDAPTHDNTLVIDDDSNDTIVSNYLLNLQVIPHG